VRVRAGVLAVAVVAVLGIAALLVAAGRDERSTAFSLDIPPSVAVTVVQKGQATCQGPITVPAAFRFVRPWISPSDAAGRIPTAPVPGSAIDLTVHDAATNAVLASGSIGAQYTTPISPIVALDRSVSSGRRIRVCLRSRGPGTVDLMGAPLPNVALVGDDGTASSAGQAALALLFLRPHSTSLLSLVPTIFARASLFRPGWVGAWTYWLLSAAFLGTFVLAAVAVTRAARSDEANDPPPGDPLQ
jgi:hypothetical protein